MTGRSIDKLLGGRRGSVTISAFESLRAGLEERLRQETEAELGAQSDARFEHTREHRYAYLQKATRQEAEAALHKDFLMEHGSVAKPAEPDPSRSAGSIALCTLAALAARRRLAGRL